MFSDSSGALLATIGSTSNPTAALAGIDAAGKSKTTMTKEQAEKTAKDFEAMFLASMLSEMFGESIGAEAFGDEDSGDIYKGMMMEEYGKQLSRAGGIGIADYITKELLKTQEV